MRNLENKKMRNLENKKMRKYYSPMLYEFMTMQYQRIIF